MFSYGHLHTDKHCTDTGCSIEDLLGVMDDRVE